MSTDLSNLKPPKGATRNRKRVGRGEGSTLGKTSGRGQKGQKSRSGGSIHPGFEGGQMPLYRRLPKHGFRNPGALDYSIVNVRDLEEYFSDGDVVDYAALRGEGLTRKKDDGVKILGDGELTKALTVRANKFSKSAAEKIAAAGGTAEVVQGG
jgi:large subunit ribosomal protein L15